MRSPIFHSRDIIASVLIVFVVLFPLGLWAEQVQQKLHVDPNLEMSNAPGKPVFVGENGMPFTKPPSADTVIENDIIDITKSAFKSGQFEKIEILALNYREKDILMPSGRAKLLRVYMGLHQAIAPAINQERDDLYWKIISDKIFLWQKEFPKSPTAIIFQSEMLVARALYFRGNKTYDKVAPANKVKFSEYTQQAHDVLVNNKATASVDPQWYVGMLAIAQAQGWDGVEFSVLAQEAIKKFPGYLQIYRAAIGSLLPKWGGSYQSIEDFARYSVSQTQAKEGQSLYARVYMFLQNEFCDCGDFVDNIFSKSIVSWPHMKKGFEDILVRYPDAYNLNFFAQFACRAGDKPTTTGLITKIMQENALQNWDASLWENCVKFTGVDTKSIAIGRLMKKDKKCYVTTWAAPPMDAAYMNRPPSPGTPMPAMIPRCDGELSDGTMIDLSLQHPTRLAVTMSPGSVYEVLQWPFNHNQFGKLEAYYGEFVKPGQYFADGGHKIEEFYNGIEILISRAAGSDNSQWDKLEKKVEAWITAYPRSTAARTMLAFIAIKRGQLFQLLAERERIYLAALQQSGQTSVAQKERLQRHVALTDGSKEYFRRAEKHLNEMKSTGNLDYKSYGMMLRLADVVDWKREPYETLLIEAVNKFPEYEELYFVALGPLTRYWRKHDAEEMAHAQHDAETAEHNTNEVQELENLANMAAQNTKRIPGLAMYARIYHAYLLHNGETIFSAVEYNPATMKAAFDDMFKQYEISKSSIKNGNDGRSASIQWGLNASAEFACLAADKPKAAEMFQKIGEVPDKSVWVNDELYNRCRTWAAAH